MSARTFFWLVVASYIGVLVWFAATVPDPVPMHFDASGGVDDWGSRAGAIGLWSVVGVVMLGGGAALARRATAGEATFLNMPHKDYWMQPERREDFRRSVEVDLLVFTAITGLLLTALMLVVGLAAQDPVPSTTWTFWPLLGAYLLATAIWTVLLLRRYRPPTV